MPLGKNVRYRWKGNVRLAFKNNEVVEVKKKGGTAHKVNPNKSFADHVRRRYGKK